MRAKIPLLILALLALPEGVRAEPNGKIVKLLTPTPRVFQNGHAVDAGAQIPRPPMDIIAVAPNRMLGVRGKDGQIYFLKPNEVVTQGYSEPGSLCVASQGDDDARSEGSVIAGTNMGSGKGSGCKLERP